MERECARLEQKKATAALEEKQILDRLWDTYGLSHAAALNIRMELESTAKAGRRAAELRREINALGRPTSGPSRSSSGSTDGMNTSRASATTCCAPRWNWKIIRDISEEMKAIFAREFKLINQCFGETFTELFGGGRAALELEDESDILNCGIEIKVQPPGKTLKVLSLLSGGEKAFVAIALYFAILKVRPTPFCVLDEIEAALDEVNVVRFARYLREMSDKTQFLVITHRRGTMEEADVLYGVTMQEQGVSRLLTVNLNELERELNIR
jgi:chromosome segregation protein